jgi:GTPase involved in cell partitioning and DNA repair
MFVIDVHGVGEGDKHKLPHETLQDLIRELKLYDENLLRRPMVVFANKYDGKGLLSLLNGLNRCILSIHVFCSKEEI